MGQCDIDCEFRRRIWNYLFFFRFRDILSDGGQRNKCYYFVVIWQTAKLSFGGGEVSAPSTSSCPREGPGTVFVSAILRWASIRRCVFTERCLLRTTYILTSWCISKFWRCQCLCSEETSGQATEEFGVDPWRYSFALNPDQFCCPLILLFCGQREYFPRKSGRS
jgi:hypothetical protein